MQSIVLSLEESADLDSTSVEALMEFERFAAARGKRLFFARLKEPAPALLTVAGMPGLTPAVCGPTRDDICRPTRTVSLSNNDVPG
jgi:sulfate permease, SulP family